MAPSQHRLTRSALLLAGVLVVVAGMPGMTEGDDLVGTSSTREVVSPDADAVVELGSRLVDNVASKLRSAAHLARDSNFRARAEFARMLV
jgi:hypothetical protein